MAEACGVANPDAPGEYACEYPDGHDRIWRYGAWQDHGAPSRTVWWVVPPFSEEEISLVARVVDLARSSPYVEEMLESELAAHGWQLIRVVPRPGGPATLPEIAALTHGSHAAPLAEYADLPESRAAGYTIIPPRRL